MDSPVFVKGAGVDCEGRIVSEAGIIHASEWVTIRPEDGEFIAHAKADIAFLLDNLERTMTYSTDLVAWSHEQAALLRAGRFAELDIEHVIEEIESVAFREKLELARRLTVLLTHLIVKSHRSCSHPGSGDRIIRRQRLAVQRHLRKTPSLRPMLEDPDFMSDVWGDAIIEVYRVQEFENHEFPDSCPWSTAEILNDKVQ